MNFNMGQLIELQKEVEIIDNTTVTKMVEQKMEEEQKRTIIFRTFNPKAKKMDRMSENVIECALKPIWQNIEFLKEEEIRKQW